MLFTMDKNKSLAIMKIVMALFIVLVPSLLGILGKETGTYLMCFVFSALLLLRIRRTEKIYVSVFHFIVLTLFFYSIVSSIWASNRGGHLTYLCVIGAVAAFFCVALDYFYESTGETLKRRMMYMLTGGGFLCAVLNICYWIIYIVPVAGETRFSQGMGNNDFLAVFMLFTICLSLILVKGNSALRKNILIPGAVVMLFVFVMAQSLVGWILAILIAAICIIQKKTAKFFVPVAIGAAVIFVLVLLTVMRSSEAGALFADILVYSVKHPFGIGGGFESAGALFKSGSYPENLSAGLFAQLFACSGILGLLCAAAICGWSVSHFVKLKSWESLSEMFIVALIMLLPFNGNFAMLFFYAALAAYNDHAASRLTGRFFRKKVLVKMSYVLGVVLVILAMLIFQCIIKGQADRRFKNEDYNDAYRLYAAASAMNIADGQSAHMAAESLRLGGSVDKNYDEAHRLIDKAIERDTKNIAHIEEKAKIYYECGEYENASEQYKEAAKRARLSEVYKLSLVEMLFEEVKQNPKGSSETKRAYEEMVQIANSTENLDYKKQINDIADKTLSYTKGELTIEETGN